MLTTATDACFFRLVHSESQIQHQEEINSLEMMMNTSQDTLRQMTVKHQATVRFKE
jgi:hypothetical protein